MAVRVFIDANIIIDFALDREFGEEAGHVLEKLTTPGYKGYISSSVLHIAGYWITKDQGSEKAKLFLLALLNNISIIDIPHETAVMALSSQFNDIEDAMQYYTAMHHNLDCFVTRDKALQKKSLPHLPIHSPNEFLNIYS